MLVKGDTYPVTVSPSLVLNGWAGGQGVQWVASAKDEFCVTRSDGLYAGFMLRGSDETSDRYTSMSGQQLAYQFGTMCAGGWLISTTTYEQHTYASRTGGGPLVPLTYGESDRLVFSLRGFWTIEDEWTLSGDPRAPNGYFIGYVAQAPSLMTSGYMTIQVSI